MEFNKLTLTQALEALRSGTYSATELTQALLKKIEQLNPKLNAFLHVQTEEALAAAAKVDTARAKGETVGTLAGIPIAVKDTIVTKGRVSAGSRMLEGFRSVYEASVVRRLKEAGAIVIGATNCDEFAFGASGEYSAYGPVHNPWDLDKVPGGSSSGSAVSVAAGLALGALGSDTGGSVRQPAGMTNTVGIRPTYGRVSRYGLIATASSLDTIGVFGKSVEDAVRMLQVIAGHDRRDATSLDEPVPEYLRLMGETQRKLRIGIPKEYFTGSLHADVRQAIEQAIMVLRRLGHEPVEISLPHTEQSLAVYYILNPSEASSNLARFDGIRYGRSPLEKDSQTTLQEIFAKSRDEGFGAEPKRRILLGTFALSSGYSAKYYQKAQQVRTLISEDFHNAFSKVDLIVTPTIPETSWKIGERVDPLRHYLADIFMTATSLAGLPAVSVPAGFVHGLPVGMQIIGQHLGEADMLGLAQQYEAECPWVGQWPELSE